MGSRRVLLSSALKSGDPAAARERGGKRGFDDVVRDIDDLRGLITELRPATLDQLGLLAALEDLAERVAHSAGDRGGHRSADRAPSASTQSWRRSSTAWRRRP